ncbi:hypothetical protein ABQF26_04655 [Mycolicibacterium elephantis]
MGETGTTWFKLAAAIAGIIATAVVAGCASSESDEAVTTASKATASTTATYSGAAYAQQVQDAILGNMVTSDYKTPTAFTDMCEFPNHWACAIESIESPREGTIDVTLRPDWEQIFGEWTGPPAGIGCTKWGERLRRNIENFTRSGGVTPPRRIAVYKPDGTFC